ncbi:hypothetical protein ACJX0J_036168, partial [Zea mays]
QEHVPQDEALGGCCDVFVRGLGRRLPVNFGLLDRCLFIMTWMAQVRVCAAHPLPRVQTSRATSEAHIEK